MSETFTYANQLGILKAMFAILVKESGGNVSITQAQLDQIQYFSLLEDYDGKGTITFRVIPLVRAQTTTQ